MTGQGHPSTASSVLFLTPPALPRHSVSRRALTYAAPSCSQQPPNLSRRLFLTHLLQTTLVFSTPTPATSSEPTSNPSVASSSSPSPAPPTPPKQPRPKPRRPLWDYKPPADPSVWSTLSDDYTILSTGIRQSPVPLSYRSSLSPPAALTRPTLSTKSVPTIVHLRDPQPNSAHKWLCLDSYIPPPPPLVGDAPPLDSYVPPTPLALLTWDTVGVFACRAVHFHAPAEHVIDGYRGVAEAHFIFERRAKTVSTPKADPPVGAGEPSDGANQTPRPPKPPASDTESKGVERSAGTDGVAAKQPFGVDSATAAPLDAPEEFKTLVVAMIGVMADESAPWLGRVLDKVRGMEDKGVVMDLNLGDALPDFQETPFYTYPGSLTTPPGTEGVCWVVLDKRMPVAGADVQRLMELQGGQNVRPLQELNARPVVRFSAEPVVRRSTR